MKTIINILKLVVLLILLFVLCKCSVSDLDCKCHCARWRNVVVPQTIFVGKTVQVVPMNMVICDKYEADSLINHTMQK
jgi:hypothetical protein